MCSSSKIIFDQKPKINFCAKYFICFLRHPQLHGSQVEPKLSQKSRQKPADPKAVKDALDYCLEIVKTRDYDNYVATLLMQKPVQCRALAVSCTWC